MNMPDEASRFNKKTLSTPMTFRHPFLPVCASLCLVTDAVGRPAVRTPRPKPNEISMVQEMRFGLIGVGAVAPRT